MEWKWFWLKIKPGEYSKTTLFCRQTVAASKCSSLFKAGSGTRRLTTADDAGKRAHFDFLQAINCSARQDMFSSLASARLSWLLIPLLQKATGRQGKVVPSRETPINYHFPTLLQSHCFFIEDFYVCLLRWRRYDKTIGISMLFPCNASCFYSSRWEPNTKFSISLIHFLVCQEMEAAKNCSIPDDQHTKGCKTERKFKMKFKI